MTSMGQTLGDSQYTTVKSTHSFHFSISIFVTTLEFTEVSVSIAKCRSIDIFYDAGNSNTASVLGTVSDKAQTESGSVVLGTSQQYAYFVYYRRSVNLYRGFVLSFNRVGEFIVCLYP